MRPAGHPGLRERVSSGLLRAGGLCMVAAGVMVVVPALAAPRATTVAPASDDTPSMAHTVPIALEPAATALLARAAKATRSQAWTGTQLVSVFGPRSTTAMVDVTHVPGIGSWLSVRPTVGAADPEGRIFEPEATDGPSGKPTDWFSLATAHYSVVSEGQRTIGELSTSSLLLSRADGTPAARFFIDVGSGLIVGREIYDCAGDLMRASTFSALETVDPGQLQDLTRQVRTAAEATLEHALGAATLDAWRQAGWTVPETVHSDFGLIDARATGTGPLDDDARLHLTYSDGLSSLSLFAEHGRLDPERLDGWTAVTRASRPVLERAGVHEQLTWSDGTLVWSIVADAPGQVVDSTIASLPHHHSHNDYSDRFSGGLSRIGTWLNPFA
jgi:hypothetical protein